MKPCVWIGICALAVSAARGEDSSNAWQFQLTPYLWLPTIDGALNYVPAPGTGGSPDFEVGPTDWLNVLNFGLLLNGNARKGRFSISADVVYLSMTKNGKTRLVSVEGNIAGSEMPIPVDADITLNSRTDLDGLTWMLTTGYTLQRTETSLFDVFAGVRYFGLDAATSWELAAAITTPGGTELLPAQGDIVNDIKIWDGIVGVRGHFGLGASKKWSVPYSFDVGAGSSDLTWNAVAGLARSFGWGDLMFVYRHLEYDQDSDGLVQEFSFSGPALGVRFRF